MMLAYLILGFIVTSILVAIEWRMIEEDFSYFFSVKVSDKAEALSALKGIGVYLVVAASCIVFWPAVILLLGLEKAAENADKKKDRWLN